MKTQIIPSFLTKTQDQFRNRFEAVSPYCKIGQVDILDNTFLPYDSFYDPKFINSLDPKMNFEIHFMINNVPVELPQWNYPWVNKIIFHIEAVARPEVLIATIKKMGKKVGVAINPETPVSKIEDLIGKVNTVLVMTAHPGRNGAPFLSETLEKIKIIRKDYPGVNIEVDGGMDLENIKATKEAGANLFVAGSFLENANFAEKLNVLKSIV